MFDRETKTCISIASKPGTFGVDFHNNAYRELGFNYVYIPLKVEENELPSIMNIVRNNMCGCSVSMPHKINVMNYLDRIDEAAKKIGAVNTILNQGGRLVGYNTDYEGAKKAISYNLDITGKNVAMLGAGGVARAIGQAVKDLGGNLSILNRTEEKARSLAKEFGCNFIGYEKRDYLSGHLFINATSQGMTDETPYLSDKAVNSFQAVMDVVVNDTSLIKEAKKRGQIVIPGKHMTLYQAAEQFKIYTGRELSESFLEQFLY